MPPVVQQPREGPFDHPPMRDDLKALASMLHDLQINLMGMFSASHPSVQPLRTIPLIDPELAQARHPIDKVVI